VLGELVAVDNTRGVVGMAPAALARVISYFDRAATFGTARVRSNVASRIPRAVQSLQFGDVLQLEVQLEGTVSGTKTLVPW
jgi:hypothetical protein